MADWVGATSSLRYLHRPSGRVEIESKEDAKKRGQQSPDRAEVLVLWRSPGPCRGSRPYLSQRYTISPV